MNKSAEAKIILKDLIGKGIDQAIKRLEEMLDPDSPLYNVLVQLKSRYSAHLSSVILGMASQKELDEQYAKLSHALIMLADGLQDSDLRRDPAAAPEAAGPRRGDLLYHIPRQMQEKREYRCAVRVAYLKDLLYADWETHADDAQKKIRVAEVMSVELANLDDDEPFSIRALHNTVQFLDENDFTEWVFLVKPKHTGEFNLALRVSVIEIRDGREVKKDVVLEQHVVVATEAPAPEAAPQFASSGMQLDFTVNDRRRPVDGTSGTAQGTRRSKSNKGLRTTALLLAFLMAGTSATWAFTPPPTRDWWLANLKNDAEAYAGYIQKYPESPHLEKAYFKKADKTGALRDLRDYQRVYPEGRFHEQVLEKIAVLEVDAVENFRRAPEAEKIAQFVQDFPESERLPEIKQAIGSRAELLPVLENAYVQSIQAQPSAQKVTAYLRDFPQRERLPEVAAAAAVRPEVMREVQSALEKAIIQKVETANTASEVQAVLPALESAGSSAGVVKVEAVIAQKPLLKKQVLPQVRRAGERVRQRERDEQLSESSKLSESSQMSPAEAQDWAAALAANTARAYADFVNKYPKTSKLDEARAKINALKPSMTLDEQAWADARQVNTPQAYIYFVQKYPRSQLTAEARQRIKTFSISVKEQKRLEAEAAERIRAEQEEQTRLAREAEERRKQEDAQGKTQETGRNDDSPPPGGQGGAKRSGLTMVSVQGGTFTMGCQDGRDKDCESDEKPAHTVTLSGFQIGKYEVTQSDWFEVMGTKPSEFKNCDDCPVEYVSCDDVQEFIKKLNKMLPAGQKPYRLPTEAEWEYAARGGHKMPKDISMMTAYAGGNDIGKVAWYDSNSGSKTHPVGTKEPNELGLYDMSGNVWEWCSDWLDDYSAAAQTNPKGPSSGSGRVVRGGSWYHYPLSVRAAYRNFFAPGDRLNNIGFRLARTN